MQVLSHVAAAEELLLPPVLAQRITAASERSLRRALLMLEVCRVAQYPFTEEQPLQAADWELYIQVRAAGQSARDSLLIPIAETGPKRANPLQFGLRRQLNT